MTDEKYVKVAVLDSKGEVVKPTFLGEFADLTDDIKISNSRDYFIEDGLIYAGFLRTYPFSFFIEGISAGVTKIEIAYTEEETISLLDRVPILPNTIMRVWVEVIGGRLHISKLDYDLDGKRNIEKEISWVEPYDSEEHINTVLAVLIKRADLTSQEQLNLFNEIEKVSYGDFLEVSKDYKDEYIVMARELVASDLVYQK